MPPRDAHSEEGVHPDVAGWVLQALDDDDARSFAAHLDECEACRAAADELRLASQAMARAAPAAEPPAGLGARTLLAVQQAAAAEPAEPQAGSEAKVIRSPRWRHPGLLVTAAGWLSAAAATIIAVAVITVPGSRPAQIIRPAHTVAFSLHSPTGGPARAEAVGTDHGAEGWSFHLSVHGLPRLPLSQVYECWYVGNPKGHPKVSGGTFGPSGAGTFTMWTGADPKQLKIMWITRRTIDSSRPGPVVLTSQAQL